MIVEQARAPARAAENHKWLYLFSSNQSTLYSQDILNVLAAPDGLHYTFRYDDQYVDEATAAAWASLLPGTRVLVVFSIQQKAEFHPAMFLPVRLGELLEAYMVGSRYFVRFALRATVSLPRPAPDDDSTKHDRWVKRFTHELGQRLNATPYDSSASLGAALLGPTSPAPVWDAASPPDMAFEQSVDYLGQTETFARTRFYRVRRIAEAGGGAEVLLDEQGVLQLHAGTMYDLEVLHSQRVSPGRSERFLVDADGVALRIIGHPGFDVASRYDRPVLRLLATPASGIETRETILDIGGSDGVEGPSVTVPVRVVANKRKAVGIAAGQAVALIAVALASTLTMLPLGVRIAFAVLGAICAAGLQLLGMTSLRTLFMPSAPRPMAAGPQGGDVLPTGAHNLASAGPSPP